jgi:hypothetical protein
VLRDEVPAERGDAGFGPDRKDAFAEPLEISAETAGDAGEPALEELAGEDDDVDGLGAREPEDFVGEVAGPVEERDAGRCEKRVEAGRMDELGELPVGGAGEGPGV